MPGLFISHSSKDKNFVRRLAIDLLNGGFPVWLDEWELEVGSSLVNKIYEGIDESTFFIIVISRNSLESGWVKKEMTGALAKEEQLQRKFVIPIRLDDCQFPLQIADRLYSDFSKGYLSAFEALTKVLKRYNIDKIPLAADKYLIPLSFRGGIHLDAQALQDRIENLVKIAPAGFEVSTDQFVFSPDDEYQKLRQRLTQRMENIEKDPYFSSAFLESFTAAYRGVLSQENDLIHGLTSILNKTVFKRRIFMYDYADACRWFALLARSNILHNLWNAQNPALPDVSPYGSDCIPSYGSDPRIYGLREMKKVYIGPADEDAWGDFNYMSIYIDANETLHQDVMVEGIPLRASVRGVCPGWVLSKYIVPQMVMQFLITKRTPVSWDFEGFQIRPDY